jgi:hypothetical protein
MIVFFVALTPLLVGLALILMIARFSPDVPRHATAHVDDELPEITGDEFRDVIVELVEKLGLTNVFESVGTGGVVELTLRDPKPLVGGRILLIATPSFKQGQVDAVDVLNFAEGVRSVPGTLKGIYVAPVGFTEEARSAARSAPAQVDLIDGVELMDLVREHLGEERADFLANYRGFVQRARRHRRHEDLEEHEG